MPVKYDLYSICRYSEALEYRQSIYSAPAGVGDVTYTTYKYNLTNASFVWLAVFNSETTGITGFKLTGNNGADGFGTASMGELGNSEIDPWYFGWYKQVVAPFLPSINHLIIAPGPYWNQTIDSNTDNGFNMLEKVRSLLGAIVHWP